MRFIFVVGAQCTGKTTLVERLAAWFAHNVPHLAVGVVRETVRIMLKLHHFTREDIRLGGPRCIQLQRLILQSQEELEQCMKSQKLDIVIANRSGVDPLVYARMYCGELAAQELAESDAWEVLMLNMRGSVLVVCEPV